MRFLRYLSILRLVIVSCAVLLSSSFEAAFAFAHPSPTTFSARGIFLTTSMPSRSRMSPLTALRGGGADGSAELSPREESLAAIKKCSRASFFAVAVDAVTRLLGAPTRGGWNVAIASRPSTWLELADVIRTFNLVAFGIGCWAVSRCYEDVFEANKNISNANNIEFSSIAKIMRAYKFMYLSTGWAMVGLSMRLAGKLMPDATTAPVLVAIAAVAGTVYVRFTFQKAIDEATAKETKDGGSVLSQAKDTRDLGIDAARNMAFCSGSFVLFAVLTFIFWIMVIVSGPAPIFVKCLTVNKFLTPFALAGLMQNMDARFLDATVEVTTSGNKKQDVFRLLKESESGFYGKVSKVLITSSILDIMRFAIPAAIGAIKG